MATATFDEIESTQTAVLTTSQLVLAAQQGDREAFGELFERYQRQVMAVALRRLGDFAEAQELCQDVFVQAILKITQLREPAAFGGWLRSITQRMAVNRLLRRGAVVPVEAETLDAVRFDEQTPDCEALSH